MMKLTTLIMLIGCLAASAGGNAQRISIHLKDASLETVFEKIKQQTKYTFVYYKDDLKLSKRVSLNVSNSNLSEVLQLCFADQPLTYTIIDNNIVIRQKITNKNLPASTTPPIDIKGKVVNENGEPVGGVTVSVKGTNKATSTDNNGEFILSNVDPNAVLVFTGTNTENFETRLQGRSELTVNLKTKITALDEMQIIAYGTTSKRLTTGAVSTIKAETIEKQPVSNVLAALNGQIPGLMITQTSGVPGAGIRVNVRGLNSLNFNANDPLYVVDGVPFTASSIGDATIFTYHGIGGSPLNAINPNDIERIEVLKDADATSIYGSRGANGVILITTKRARSSKMGLSANVYHGVGTVSRKLKLLNRRQYLDMRYEAFANDGIDWKDPNVIANDLKVWDTTRYTDWQEELLGGTARTTNAQLSLTGGSPQTQFTVSGNYWKETTVFPGDFNDQKLSARFGFNHQALDNRFTVDFSSFYLFDNNKLPFFDLTNYSTLSPVAPDPFLEDGNLNWANGTFNNPFSNVLQRFEVKSHNLNSSALFSYQPVRNLWIRSSIGFNRNSHNRISLFPTASIDPYSPWGGTNNAMYGNATSSGWNVEPYAEYETKLGPGRLKSLLVATFQHSSDEGSSIRAEDFTDDALMYNPAAGAMQWIQPSTFSEYKYNAISARLNYNIGNKYLMNINVRRDGSSRFGPDRQFGNFWSVGLGWVFSEESFIRRGLPFLSYGKLRGSYGVGGSDAVGDYTYLPTYSSWFSTYGGAGTLYPDRLYNPNFGWESSNKADVQLDLGFLKDRLTLSANYYHNRSSNQLVGITLPATTGFPSVAGNLDATVENSGWEFLMNSENIRTNSFSWTTSFNLTMPRNRLVDFPNLEYSTQRFYYAIGQSLDLQKTIPFVGVNPQTGVNMYRDRNGKDTSFSNSFFFTIDDYTSMVNKLMHYFGGFTNSLSLKGVSLDFMFQFSKKTRSNDIAILNGNVPGTSYNQSVYVFNNSWRKPGDQAIYQKFTQDESSPAYRSRLTNSTSARFTDVSFVRLNNVSLSYNLPAKWIQRMHFNNASIYVRAQNLLTITNFEGLDPEGGNGSLPRLKVITAGFQINL